MNPADWVALKRGGYGDFFQRLLDYDSNNNLIYYGIAPRGKATSDAFWTIEKFAYDANNNLTSQKCAVEFSIWDNRVSLTYA